MSNLEEGPTVANTKKCTNWAVWVFTAWRQARNVTQEDRCPTDLLENPFAGQLNYWLSRFVVEARRADGERYPSATLYQLLSGLLRYARSKSKRCPNFLDKKDQRFAELRGTCESVSRDLCCLFLDLQLHIHNSVALSNSLILLHWFPLCLVA